MCVCVIILLFAVPKKVFLFAGEKEGQMDPKGDEGVPRVRGEGGRLQGQAPRVQPS